MIEELPDRWLVRPRHVRIESVALPAADVLVVQFRYGSAS